MKIILLCFLNFFICYFAQAQTYHSFMHDTAVWDEYEATGCCDPGNSCVEYYETIWIMEGDTFVGNLSYKKLFFEVINYYKDMGSPWCLDICGFWSSGYFWNQYLFGLIREDSTKKVFLLANPAVKPPITCAIDSDFNQMDFSTEKILYDFNLDIGDTVKWKPFDNVVIGIDSVQAPDGEFLRRIKFDYSQDQWIEGLGSEIALFGSYMPPPFECGCGLECAQASDLLTPGSLPCGFPVGVTEAQPRNQLQLSPNPFSNFVSVTSPFQSSSILSVVNAQGQVILKKQLLPLEKISLSDQELKSSGVIFFRLVSDDGNVQSAIAIHSF